MFSQCAIRSQQRPTPSSLSRLLRRPSSIKRTRWTVSPLQHLSFTLLLSLTHYIFDCFVYCPIPPFRSLASFLSSLLVSVHSFPLFSFFPFLYIMIHP
ncbi:hypothetical protein M422DRAFT_31379 [Sphaerobolus stellatus SS14]|uniref:Uncharacterized protein n=1 Tax=Sphaerobolus stellatus (strain SS14) TaxID=990650 RepID=A0A0C9VVY4_SPHS4|nr:hypothetical protein M422DRAFT_31379 [Sphaerobolus stellatus SS14]